MFHWFENRVDPFASYDESATPPKRVVPFICFYLRPFWHVCLITLLVSAIAATLDVWLAYYTGQLIDTLTQIDQQNRQTLHLFLQELLLVGAVLLILRPLVNTLLAGLLNQTLMPNLGTLVRWRVHRHVVRQSVSWFDKDLSGRIANRVMQVPPAIGAVVFHLFDGIVYATIYITATLITLSDIDSQMLLPMLVWFVIYISLIIFFIPRVGRASEAFSQTRSDINGHVVDAYTHIRTIKLFTHQKQEENRATAGIRRARDAFIRELRLYSYIDISLTFINSLLIVGVVGWAIYLWLHDQTSIGSVAVAAALTLRLNGITDWVTSSLAQLFQELGIVREGMQTISQPIDGADRVDARPLQLTSGRIEFEQVSHHYSKNQRGLCEINTVIEPGEKVGLIGRSGAGKSTFVNLLLRFYALEQGRILIDGQDIQQVQQDSLRGHIAMVMQDNSLMHQSIRDNILCGNHGASDAEMIEAAKRAKAHEFICQLVDSEQRTGYDAWVGERGVKLSGGQRQRIAIARIMLKKAPILILDEATSALDSEGEAVIQNELAEIMAGKTVVAIAHRLSTIAHMDRILVLDHGSIIEEGSHSALLEKRGLYYRFWSRQAGGFINPDDPS